MLYSRTFLNSEKFHHGRHTVLFLEFAPALTPAPARALLPPNGALLSAPPVAKGDKNRTALPPLCSQLRQLRKLCGPFFPMTVSPFDAGSHSFPCYHLNCSSSPFFFPPPLFKPTPATRGNYFPQFVPYTPFVAVPSPICSLGVFTCPLLLFRLAAHGYFSFPRQYRPNIVLHSFTASSPSPPVRTPQVHRVKYLSPLWTKPKMPNTPASPLARQARTSLRPREELTPLLSAPPGCVPICPSAPSQPHQVLAPAPGRASHILNIRQPHASFTTPALNFPSEKFL